MAVMTKISNTEALDGIRLVAGTEDGTCSSFASIVIEESFPHPALTAEDYPVLAAIWDNEEDAVYDDM